MSSSSGINSRRNFETVPSKMLANADSIVSYKCGYFTCVSLSATHVLVLCRWNSVYQMSVVA